MKPAGLLCLFAISMSFLCADQAKANEDLRPLFTMMPDKGTKTPDSIEVRYWEDNVTMSYGQKSFVEYFNDGRSKFNLPKINHLIRFKVIFYYGKNGISSYYQYAEPEDNVKILFKIEKDNPTRMLFQATGTGAEKYSLRVLLGDELYTTKHLVNDFRGKSDTDDKIRLGTATSVEIYKYLDTISAIVSKSKTKANEIANKFALKINADLLDFYKYEFLIADINYFLYSGYVESQKTETKKLFANYFSAPANSISKIITDNKLLKFSSSYIFNLGYQMVLEESIKTRGGVLSFMNFYARIKSLKNSDIRDRLLIELFITPTMTRFIQNYEQRDSCLADAMAIIQAPYLVNVLHEYKVFNYGSEVFNFSFQDKYGSFVQLSDLKGKVFLIEFYGWGCTGCAQFHSQFEKEIYPSFAGNENFKVLSVSVDSSPEMWEKSMKSGRYTSDQYINLYAGKENINNPMFKYYKVNAIPFILLIDKNGRLITRFYNGIPSSAIVNQIKQTLLKTVNSK